MNKGHDKLCSSPRWAEFIAGTVVPQALDGHEVGERLLEIGPGYGAATARLIADGRTVRAVEADPRLATRLRERFRDAPAIEVLDGRGEAVPYDDASFSSVVCFTMLHHVHRPSVQDALFAEAHRVLERGGLFAGSDSVASPGLRNFHHDDIYTPVDPDGLADRLRTVGFKDIEVVRAPTGEWFRFAARRR